MLERKANSIALAGIAILGALAVGSPAPARAQASPAIGPGPTPPVAARVPKVLEFNGSRRADDYDWMRDKSDPRLKAYLEAENAYAAAFMKPTEALQARIFAEISGRLAPDESTLPFEENGYLYFTRFETGEGVSPVLPPEGGRRRGRRGDARRQRARRGTRDLQDQPAGRQPRQPAAGVRRRHLRRPPAHDPLQGPRHRPAARRRPPRHVRGGGVGGRQPERPLHDAGRLRSHLPRRAARHRPAGRERRRPLPGGRPDVRGGALPLEVARLCARRDLERDDLGVPDPGPRRPKTRSSRSSSRGPRACATGSSTAEGPSTSAPTSAPPISG